MSGERDRTYRVIQWSTGNVGRQTLAAIIDHPRLELAGVFAHSPDKAGRDAGELCHRGFQGVAATGDADALVALDADCVCYTPLFADEGLLARLLASGKNVVTTSGYLYAARTRGPQSVARIEAACREGRASLFGTGINPGFLHLLPMILSSPCRRIESVLWEEYSWAGLYDSPESWSFLGLGLTPEDRARKLGGSVASEGAPSSLDMVPFLESVYLVADALGLGIEGHRVEEETALATRPIELPWTTLQPGTVAGLRITASGLVDGQPVVTGRVNWYMGPDIEPDDWVHERSLREWYGRVVIEGEPRIACDLGLGGGTLSDPALTGSLVDHPLIATGMAAVNAIPAVCAAEPGIRSYLDLPVARFWR